MLTLSERTTFGAPPNLSSASVQYASASLRRFGLTLVILVCALASSASTYADDPPQLSDAALVELAREFASGESAAMATLRAQGPAIIPRLRPLLLKDDGPRLRRLIRGIALDRIRLSLVVEGDVRYRGQFVAFGDLGPEGADVLLDVFADEDHVLAVRDRAATALGDVGGPAQVDALREIADDFLAEAPIEREAVFLLARFGDRDRVDRLIARLAKIADQPRTTATLPTILTAHGDLGEVHYRIDEFDVAISHYREKQALLEEMQQRVRPELREPLQEEINLLQYNLACSLALAGRIEEAYAALDLSMASRRVTLDMVRTDGDLRAVRGNERYAAWLAAWEQKRPGPPVDEPTPPPMKGGEPPGP